MYRTVTKRALSAILVGICLLAVGCDERDWGCGGGCGGCGDWSDIGISFGYWPSGGCGGVVEDYTEVYGGYYGESYGYTDSGYGDYYYDGYYDCPDCAWKNKKADRRR